MWPFRKKHFLQIGQVRIITIEHVPQVAGITSLFPIGTKVIVKGAGEYDGWDVEVLLSDGRIYAVGSTWLLENSEVL